MIFPAIRDPGPCSWGKRAEGIFDRQQPEGRCGGHILGKKSTAFWVKKNLSYPISPNNTANH